MNEIYVSIQNKLATDLAPVSVFDNVPEDNYSFPYVRVDPLVLNNNDTDAERGFDATVQIISFSQSKGSKEVSGLNKQIYDSLHRFALPDTTSFGISALQQEFSTIAMDESGLHKGVTRVSVQRFNVIFEDLPA